MLLWVMLCLAHKNPDRLAAQDLAGRHHYRPGDPAAAARHARQFPKIQLFTVNELFGSWALAQKAHFADGGSFDLVSTRK